MPPPAWPIPTILIASPDPLASEQLTKLLTFWHYQIKTASSGLDALRLLTSAAHPEIALLDSDLPEINGIGIATELRRSQKRPAWTMLLSTNADSNFIRTATDAGIDDFLLKPVDMEDLKVRLHVAERMMALTKHLEQQNETTQYQITHDALTGLWNREALMRLLFQETDRVQRMKTPLTFVLLDLDGFSQVNVQFGYEAGDNVLRELANRFRRHLRSYDLVGRYSEDEFLLALPGCASGHAVAMTQRMVKSVLQRPFDVGYEMISLTASIGLAQSRGRSPLVVLREVESALAEAKLAGRNCIRSYPGSIGRNNIETLQWPAPVEAVPQTR